MVPVTHLLYLGSFIFLVGLYRLLGTPRARPGAVQVAYAGLGLGACLMGVAFARYWGAAAGQNLGLACAVLAFLRGLMAAGVDVGAPSADGGHPGREVEGPARAGGDA